MKRLSAFRLTLILITLGLVAINILFGVLAYQDFGEEGKLEDEVQAVELDIARLAGLSDVDALAAEIASLVAELNDMPFPESVDNDAIFGLVHASAATADATIETWAVEGIATEAINGSALEYTVFLYEVKASGALSNILVFLGEMEANAPHETMRLDEVELTYDEGSDSWSIEFEIQVFAQP